MIDSWSINKKVFIKNLRLESLLLFNWFVIIVRDLSECMQENPFQSLAKGKIVYLNSILKYHTHKLPQFDLYLTKPCTCHKLGLVRIILFVYKSLAFKLTKTTFCLNFKHHKGLLYFYFSRYRWKVFLPKHTYRFWRKKKANKRIQIYISKETFLLLSATQKYF